MKIRVEIAFGHPGGSRVARFQDVPFPPPACGSPQRRLRGSLIEQVALLWKEPSYQPKIELNVSTDTWPTATFGERK